MNLGTGKRKDQEESTMSGLAEFFVRQGWEQGTNDKTIEIAKRMIGNHRCVDDIVELTDLDRDALEALAAEIGEKLQKAP